MLSEDSDYVLISVTLFRRVADTFKANCRTKGFQVEQNPPMIASHVCV